MLDAWGHICLPRRAPNVLNGLLLRKNFLSGIGGVFYSVPLKNLGKYRLGPFVKFAFSSEQRHLRDRLSGLFAHHERLIWLES